MSDIVKRAEILGDLWMSHRQDEGLADFVTYNDLGMPLAYAMAHNLANLTEEGRIYVNETYDLLLVTLGCPIQEYDSLEEIFDHAGQVDYDGDLIDDELDDLDEEDEVEEH